MNILQKNKAENHLAEAVAQGYPELNPTGLKTSPSLRRMKWTDERATENQVNRLRQFGYEPNHPLAKDEASRLIRDFEAHPKAQAALAESATGEVAKHEAYGLRAAVESAKRAVAQAGKDEAQNFRQDLALALAKRQELWVDTCSDVEKMCVVSMEARDLHKQYRCRFAAPTAQQVQDIFDALDSAMPFWDRDQPELFYRTLELNFPELLRHPAGSGT